MMCVNVCLAQCESVCSMCWRATSWVINDRVKSRGVRKVHKLFLALQVDTIWAKAIYGGRTWLSIPLWASVLLTAACLTSGGTNCNLTNTNTNHRQTAVHKVQPEVSRIFPQLLVTNGGWLRSRADSLLYKWWKELTQDWKLRQAVHCVP